VVGDRQTATTEDEEGCDVFLGSWSHVKGRKCEGGAPDGYFKPKWRESKGGGVRLRCDNESMGGSNARLCVGMRGGGVRRLSGEHGSVSMVEQRVSRGSEREGEGADVRAHGAASERGSGS
jgi:hypothetical protein